MSGDPDHGRPQGPSGSPPGPPPIPRMLLLAATQRGPAPPPHPAPNTQHPSQPQQSQPSSQPASNAAVAAALRFRPASVAPPISSSRSQQVPAAAGPVPSQPNQTIVHAATAGLQAPLSAAVTQPHVPRMVPTSIVPPAATAAAQPRAAIPAGVAAAGNVAAAPVSSQRRAPVAGATVGLQTHPKQAQQLQPQQRQRQQQPHVQVQQQHAAAAAPAAPAVHAPKHLAAPGSRTQGPTAPPPKAVPPSQPPVRTGATAGAPASVTAATASAMASLVQVQAQLGAPAQAPTRQQQPTMAMQQQLRPSRPSASGAATAGGGRSPFPVGRLVPRGITTMHAASNKVSIGVSGATNGSGVGSGAPTSQGSGGAGGSGWGAFGGPGRGPPQAVPEDPRRAWPGSEWMRRVSQGVRVKGTRLARMMDGIFDTDVPDMYRVHSTSGQAEWWPVDMAAVICGCPNDSDMCSHMFGVCVAHPRYRPKVSLLIRAREMVEDASVSQTAIPELVSQLARGLQRQLVAADMNSVNSACQVAAEAVVALLLQGVCADRDVYGPGRPFSAQRAHWWRSAAQAAEAGKTRADSATIAALESAIASAPVDTSQQLEKALYKAVNTLAAKTATEHAALTARLKQAQELLAQVGVSTESKGAASGQSKVDGEGAAVPETSPAEQLLSGIEQRLGLQADEMGAAEQGSTEDESSEEEGGDQDGAGETTSSSQKLVHRSMPQLFYALQEEVCQILGLDDLPQLPANAQKLRKLQKKHGFSAEDGELSSPAPPLGNRKGAAATEPSPSTLGLPIKHVMRADLLSALVHNGGLSRRVHILCKAALVNSSLVGSLRAAEKLCKEALKGGGILQPQISQRVQAAIDGTAKNDASFLDQDLQPLVATVLSAMEHQRPSGNSSTAVLAGAEKAAPASGLDAADSQAQAEAAVSLCRHLVQLDLEVRKRTVQAVPSSSGKPSKGANKAVKASQPQDHQSPGLLEVLHKALPFSAHSTQLMSALGTWLAVVVQQEGLQLGRAGADSGEQQRGPLALSAGAASLQDLEAFCAQAVAAATAGTGTAADLQALASSVCDAAQRQFYASGSQGASSAEFAAAAEVIPQLVDKVLTQQRAGTAAHSSRPLYAQALLVGCSQAAVIDAAELDLGEQRAVPLLLPSHNSDSKTAGTEGTSTAVVQLVQGAQSCVHLRLDSSVSVSALRDAVYRLDGRAAVAAALGLVVLHAGVVPGCPLQLMQACTSEAAEQIVHLLLDAGQSDVSQMHSQRQLASSVDVLSCVASYIVDVAAALPEPFRSCTELLQILLPPAILYSLPSSASAVNTSLSQNVTTPAQAALQLVQSMPSKQLQLIAYHALHAIGRVIRAEAWVQLGSSWGEWSPNLAAVTAPDQSPQPDAQPEDGTAAAGDPLMPFVTPHQGAPASARLHDPPGAQDDIPPELFVLQQAPPTTMSALASGASAQVQAGGASPSPSAQSAAPQASTAAQAAVIEDIRQREFGIGIPSMTPEMSQVLSAQHARLRRALERLSADLYSQQVHVLLELLQNADDCAYGSEVVPTLGLWVGQDGVAACCNELGFSEANVRALCDVGASSKAAAKAAAGAADSESGQTGEKGIGFKSVFAVSDEPHISSNGFIFKFDAADPSGIGMVLPQWAGPAPSAPAPPHGQSSFSWSANSWPAAPVPPGESTTAWATRIWLPAAPRLTEAPAAAASMVNSSASKPTAWSTLASELLGEVRPSLLLFLRRIRRLVVHDAAASAASGVHTVHVLQRSEEPVPLGNTNSSDRGSSTCITQVTWDTYELGPGSWDADSATAAMKEQPPSQTRTFRWLRAAHCIRQPAILRRAAVMPQTFVEVALPLSDAAASRCTSTQDLAESGAGHVSDPAGDPSAWVDTPRVHAYLPLRAAGLPFWLQADWLVPSSREDVLAGEAWNQMLREHVPAAFVQAVTAARQCPGLLHTWPAFLPQASAALGFFRPLAPLITAALRQVECVPTATPGCLAKPCDVLLADEDLMQLVPEDQLWLVLRKRYAHPLLLEGSSASSLQPLHHASRTSASASSRSVEHTLLQLGAQRADVSHLLKVLRAVSPQALLDSYAQKVLGLRQIGVQTPVAKTAAPWALMAVLERLSAQSEEGQLSAGSGRLSHQAAHTLHTSAQLCVELSELSIIPLADGSLAPARQGLFTPRSLADLLQTLDTADSAAGSRDTSPEPHGLADVSKLQGPAVTPVKLSEAGTLGEGSFAYGFEGQLPVVDVTGLAQLTGQQSVRQRAVQFLQARMHIRSLQPQDIIERHVLPELVQRAQGPLGSWQGQEHVLIGYAAYLMHHQHLARSVATAGAWRHALQWVLVPPDLAAVHAPQEEGMPSNGQALTPNYSSMTPTSFSSASVVRSSEGFCIGLSATAAALPPAYVLPVPLLDTAAQALYLTPCALHPGYLQFGPLLQWAEFAGELLGCPCGLIRPRPVQRPLSPTELQQLKATALDAAAALQAAQVLDVSCSELQVLFDWISARSNHSAAVSLWELVDGLWERQLSKQACLQLESPVALTSSAADAAGSTQPPSTPGHLVEAVQSLPTSLMRLLRAASMPLQQLPGSHNDTAGFVQLGQGLALVRSAANLNVLGPAASYVAVTFRAEGLATALGLVNAPSVDAVLQQLKAWSSVAHKLSGAGSASAQSQTTGQARNAQPSQPVSPAASERLKHSAESTAGSQALSENLHGQQLPSMEVLAGVYSFLADACAASQQPNNRESDDAGGSHAEAIRVAFHAHPLIAIPSTASPQPASTFLSGATPVASVEDAVDVNNSNAADAQADTPAAAVDEAGVPQTASSATPFPLAFLSPSEVSWRDDAGIVCGRLQPQPLHRLYPRAHQLFVHVVGVPEAPSDAHVLQALVKARAAQDASWAWACLAHVGQTLLAQELSAAVGPGSQHNSIQDNQRQNIGNRHKSRHVDWAEVLSSQELLPAVGGGWVSASTGAVFVHWGPMSGLAAADKSMVPAAKEVVDGQGCLQIRQQVSEEDVQQLLAAAKAEGAALHVLSPAEVHSMDQGAESGQSSTRHKHKAGNKKAGRKPLASGAGATPGSGVLTSSSADTKLVDGLMKLLTQVLGLSNLSHAILRAPVDGSMQPIPVSYLQRSSGRGGEMLLPEGGRLLPQAMQQLTHALPFVLRYLHDHDSPLVKEEGQLASVAQILQNLRVISVAGLQHMLVLSEVGVATDATSAQALLDTRILAQGGCSCSLLVHAPLDAAEASADLGLSAWRSLITEFSRLFNGGAVDPGMVSMLLVLHSLRSQPLTEIEPALEAMCQLPAADGLVAELLASARLGEVGAAWSKPAASAITADIGRSAGLDGFATAPAGQSDEVDEEGEEMIVWGGAKQDEHSQLSQPAGNGAVLRADAEDQGSGLLGSGEGPDQGVDHGRGGRGQDPAAGARAMRQLLGSERPKGKFQEEEVQVTRTAMAPMRVLPDQGKTAARELVGRLGEELVFRVLEEAATGGDRVQWMNGEDEQGLPYDVLITHVDGSVTYIEVKATSTGDKSYFEISHREWIFAQQEGERYQIFRVCGIGSPEPTIKRITNPYLQWRSQRVGICLAL